MDIGVFQLLPRGGAATDREVVEQALWEVDFAERHGFESVWVTEHHFSGLRRICVENTDGEAWREVQEALRWEREMAIHFHELGEAIETVPTLADGSMIETTDGAGIGACFGSVATLTRQLDELRALGLRKVIGWFHFGNMPYGSVRRSMQFMASEVTPRLCRERGRPVPAT